MRPRSWRAPSAGCGPLRAVSWAQTALAAPVGALNRGSEKPLRRRSHPCQLRRRGPVRLRLTSAPCGHGLFSSRSSFALPSSIRASEEPFGRPGQRMKGFMRTWRGLAGKSATDTYVSSAESARAGNPKTGWVLSEAAERPRARLKCSGRFSALRLQFGGPLSSQEPTRF